MPTINAFYKNEEQQSKLASLIPQLKECVAQELTCGDINLTTKEVSVRLVYVQGDGMLGSVEIEITAHAFEERVKRQDEICLTIANYVKKQEPSLGEVKVWLILSQLGHSWR